MKKRQASIDMGTNTFQLLIADVIDEKKIERIYQEDIFVRLGKGGISKGILTEEAMQRAFDALEVFNKKILKLEVEKVIVGATSAVRSAKNGKFFIENIQSKFGFTPKIIEGEEEAKVIYYGVKSDIDLTETSIIMDIGGGSVEFIICDNERILWKQSFEIGAQRLYDLFCKQDPIDKQDLLALKTFVVTQLNDLWKAVDLHLPVKIIGAAGTFETLQEIYGSMNSIVPSKVKQVEVIAYHKMYKMFIEFTLSERLKIPGLIKERVNMIVPASVLLMTVLEVLNYSKIDISGASLREGLLLYKID
ncbi:phosphatase [Flammeovirga pectinis]|uniref:Phosphatase n=1 Tax=Flammeovirga pectinis TaxID=2494373 RepID=A0A3S9P592_9BACT|nr:phosphatase [Flammeovirga pectinis]AZQ63377.1 phosphatase [Flammeovirga pectinis]